MIRQEIELGRSIAKTYILAQEINQTASNAACNAMEDATPAMKFGFTSEMQKSNYNISY